VTRQIGGPFSAEAVQERLDREAATLRSHGIQYWPIFLLATGELVGCCGLRPYGSEEKTYEIGFHIRPEHWGKGYASEAARAVIAHAFQNLGAAGLFAGHHPDNHASRSVLEKLGFRHSHDELYAPTGLLHPSYWLRESGELPVMRYTFRVDASYDRVRAVTGIGIVLSGTAKKTSRPGPTIELRSEAYRSVPAGAGEELAVLRALELAAERGYRRVRVDSDYNLLKRRLKKAHAKGTEADQDTLRGMVLRLAQQFDECRFAWILRRKNGQAHRLARLGAQEVEPVERADIRWREYRKAET
jgi:ribosomal-protein-alanine N-acetyltransferase